MRGRQKRLKAITRTSSAVKKMTRIEENDFH
jgi:hypothetical protein